MQENNVLESGQAHPARWQVEGTIIDVVNGRQFRGRIHICGKRIDRIEADETVASLPVYAPGLVDAHVHVESSMLSPREFARCAVRQGTVATVSDPHEIANVLGIEGVRFMIRDAETVPFKFHFGAPSCVPATPFETAGAAFGASEIGSLLDQPGVHYLAEVMNFPGVINDDPALIAILDEAKRRRVCIDGHAPGVMGEDLEAYAAHGIQTDHECTTLEEGEARIRAGMKVAIREGSAARNFEALYPLLKKHPESVFLCTDDLHPDLLVQGHINEIVRRAMANGVTAMNALRAATLNPVRHYGLPVGLLQEGDPADLIEIESLNTMRVTRTWIDGQLVSENERPAWSYSRPATPNLFKRNTVRTSSLRIPARKGRFASIVAIDGQLLTGREDIDPTVRDGGVVADPERNLLKIAVFSRYDNKPPALGLVRNFGFYQGAIASSVAHDSHNIVAVGADDESLAEAVNAVVEAKGGLAAIFPRVRHVLALPIAGLMSPKDFFSVAQEYEMLDRAAREAQCSLASPFMNLSFLALPVIPRLKITDHGLFDAESFSLIDPWVEV